MSADAVSSVGRDDHFRRRSLPLRTLANGLQPELETLGHPVAMLGVIRPHRAVVEREPRRARPPPSTDTASD